MNHNDAIALLKRKQGRRTLSAFARDIGVTVAYLSDVYRGNRQVGPKLLELVRLKKTRRIQVTYEVSR